MSRYPELDKLKFKQMLHKAISEAEGDLQAFYNKRAQSAEDALPLIGNKTNDLGWKDRIVDYADDMGNFINSHGVREYPKNANLNKVDSVQAKGQEPLYGDKGKTIGYKYPDTRNYEDMQKKTYNATQPVKESSMLARKQKVLEDIRKIKDLKRVAENKKIKDLNRFMMEDSGENFNKLG